MPIYDHRCDHCGHAFSVVRSYTDPPVEKCPSCGKRPRRLISTPAIVFKGSGWYKTDSRATSGAAKDAGSSDGSERRPEKKGDAAKTGEAAKEAAKTGDGDKGSAPAPAASGEGSSGSGGTAAS